MSACWRCVGFHPQCGAALINCLLLNDLAHTLLALDLPNSVELNDMRVHCRLRRLLQHQQLWNRHRLHLPQRLP